jgi:hypothetical protein
VSPRPRRYGGGGLRAPKEVNKTKCPVCGAEKGDTCFVLTDRSFRELRVTHRSKERQRAAAQKKALSMEADRPMALDRTL